MRGVSCEAIEAWNESKTYRSVMCLIRFGGLVKIPAEAAIEAAVMDMSPVTEEVRKSTLSSAKDFERLTHHEANSCTTTYPDRLRRILAQRINEAHQANNGEVDVEGSE